MTSKPLDHVVVLSVAGQKRYVSDYPLDGTTFYVADDLSEVRYYCRYQARRIAQALRKQGWAASAQHTDSKSAKSRLGASDANRPAAVH